MRAHITLLALVAITLTSFLQAGSVDYLKELEAKMLAVHPQYLASHAGERSAYELYLQAWSGWLPDIKASASYHDDKLKGHYEAGIMLTQTIFHSSKWMAVYLKKTDWALANAKLAQVKADLLYELRLGYYKLVVACEEVSVAKETIDFLTASYQREKLRFDLGEVTSFGLSQSRVALTSALADLYQAQANYKKAAHRLSNAVGVSLDQLDLGRIFASAKLPYERIDLIKNQLDKLKISQADQLMALAKDSLGESEDASLRHKLFKQEIMQSYEELALQYSPIIRQSLLTLSKASYQLRSKQLDYLPSVTAAASYDNSFNRGKGTPFNSRYDSSIALSLFWNVFDGFAKEHQVAQAGFEKAGANELLLEHRRLTRHLIHDGFCDLEQALLTHVASEQSAQLATVAMEQALEQLDLGAISSLEYREASALLARAKKDALRSCYTLLQAYFRLVRDCGQDIVDDYIQN